jgi:superfamily II DNA or RNA helicase
MAVKLRKYQTEAIEAIEARLSGSRATLLVLPTGTGKTVVFSEVAARFWEREKRPIMVLAHRSELLRQAGEKLLATGYFGKEHIAYELGSETAYDAFGGVFSPRVILASKDSLHTKRLHKYDQKSIGLIIVDEAHRGVAKTYQSIYNYFDSSQLLGVTATPDRLDGKRILGVFDSVAYVYEIRDAIEEGYLVPITQQAVKVDAIDLREVKATREDFDESQLNEVMIRESAVHGIAVPTLELAEGRPTFVFCTSIAHSKAVAEMLNRYRYDCARAIDGTLDADQRARVLEDFKAGKFQFLCNCQLLTEGIDIPSVACVAMARPTKSRTLYSQAIGRGTRLLGNTLDDSIENGKPNLLVIDYAGNAGKHSLITALDVLDGGGDDERIKQTAARIVEAGGKPKNVLEALAEAEEIVAKERRAELLARVQYRLSGPISPFAVLGIAPRPGRWGGAEITEAQASYLESMGIAPKDIAHMDKGQASETIDALRKRREAGLCSWKMARQLAARGINPDLPFDVARMAMDYISSHGWRLDFYQKQELHRRIADMTNGAVLSHKPVELVSVEL